MAPNIETKDEVKFSINGKPYILGEDIPSSTTLLQFIRENASLPGTKALCYEGGCGVCTVVASAFDHESSTTKVFSVPSCQTLVYSCAGWSVQTIENLGDRYQGYDRLQTALRGFYGTQCGYCSPGFIMTMHGQVESTTNLKVNQVEKAFDGNICRCTGYRPILDAFKSFAVDAPPRLTTQLADIEEAYKQRCSKSGLPCDGRCSKDCGSECGKVSFNPGSNIICERNGIRWYRPTTIESLYEVLQTKKNSEKFRIVVGNTGQGVFKNEGPFDIYINTSGIKDLYTVESKNVTIGANVSLQRCIELFHQLAKQQKGYHHLEEVAKHWEHVANVGIRNVGSWGGNLAMKHSHPGFCSDIYLTLVACEARMKIGSGSSISEVSFEEFLSFDMSKSIILSMTIPPQPESVKVRSFKITPRAVNAHAYVNAAFKFHMDPKDGYRIVNIPIIAFGGINSSFTRAIKTERYFVNKQLCNKDDVVSAIKLLASEIIPEPLPQDSSPEFRVSLCQSLLYKAILSFVENLATSQNHSGGFDLERPISSGKQEFDANKDTWPIGEALPKLESETQISGEAEYLDDIPSLPEELYGAFVQSSIAKGKIKSILTTECLGVSGVVDFVTAKDIPGVNSYMRSCPTHDPIFADSEILFAGQSIGLVVATSRTIAIEAAKLVKVIYEDVQKPVLSIKDSISNERTLKAVHFVTQTDDPIIAGDTEAAFSKAKHVLEGELEQGSQFHFTMEPLAARVVPMEDGYDVYCTSQFATEVQSVISTVLNISSNCINMSVRRIGGGYGGKSTSSFFIGAATAVAAHKLRKPVRVTLDLTTHMTLVGWREPYYSKYKVGFDDQGRLEAASIDIYSDTGFSGNECSSPFAAPDIPNTYHCPNWKIQPYAALTDTAPNTWCRAPGHVEAIATIENIMEHIADYLKMDPAEIRERNFYDSKRPEVVRSSTENVVKSTIFPALKANSNLKERKLNVQQFNKNNRWKKRGISILPMKYPLHYPPFFQYNVQVVIYEHDGTVAIKHGGIEMGQGINTKVAQVAAKIFDIPLEKIIIKAPDVFAGANSALTAGSFGSDINAYGVKICCERIKDRMTPVAEKLKLANGETSWLELVKKCFQEEVDLCERYFTVSKEHPKPYDIWAAACLEVEVDVLTGQYVILRTDILEDCGRSLSPYVDIGQIEGAFIMGIGFYTSEKVKFDPATGQKLSNGTWEYKPLTALDIPVDFRVTFLPRGDNPNGVVRSKATGEPALCLSYVVVTALREAIKSARADQGIHGWFEMNTPITVEKVHQLCNTDPSNFSI